MRCQLLFKTKAKFDSTFQIHYILNINIRVGNSQRFRDRHIFINTILTILVKLVAVYLASKNFIDINNVF